jgi:hypothetical protein
MANIWKKKTNQFLRKFEFRFYLSYHDCYLAILWSIKRNAGSMTSSQFFQTFLLLSFRIFFHYVLLRPYYKYGTYKCYRPGFWDRMVRIWKLSFGCLSLAVTVNRADSGQLKFWSEPSEILNVRSSRTP